MCDGKLGPRKQQPLLMLGLKSYETGNGSPPGRVSTLVTAMFIIGFLIISEAIMGAVFFSIKDLHPILNDEINRGILARHIGVDAVSCLTCALLGWGARHVANDLKSAVVSGKNSMAPGGFEKRVFTYIPAVFRIAVVFFAYQVKNLYDSLMWGDGPEFIAHHIISMCVAWGAMHPGYGHFYAVFFFGLSEISTAVLCVLVNFDEEHGVPGLGEAFPLVKIGLGALFAVLFIVCRTIIWPIGSYYFVRDSRLALKGQCPRAEERKGWIWLFVISLSGLSVLQVAWLFQIFITAKKEFEAIGLI